MYALTLVASLGLTGFSSQAQEVYGMDEQGHTEIFFGWSHAGVSMQHGEFTKASGTLNLFPKDIGKSTVDVTIDVSSISTGFDALDKKLKESGWLDVEKHPEITFTTTSVEQTGNDTAKVTGDLTMHGVTKSVVLDTKLTHRGAHPVGQYIDYYKGDWVAFHATGKLDHTSFKVGPYSTGPISIEINAEFKGK